MNAYLRTNYGFPILTRTGEPSALWSCDRITILKRSGRKRLIRAEWGERMDGKPHSLEAWIDKRLLRISPSATTPAPSE